MTRAITLLGYALIAVAAIAVEFAARRDRWTSLGDAARLATSRPCGRLLVFLGWAWLGWHLFVRR